MKSIKMNWGAGITAVYAGFVLMIATLVGMSTSQKIDLVTDHYYEEELKFQDKISKRKRADALAQPLNWTVGATALEVQYPSALAENVGGTIRFYCPSNDKNDRTYAVNAVAGKQSIPLENIPDGRYQIQIDWTADGIAYWNEGVIRIEHTK